MEPFPNIQDRKENHDYAPEPLLLLRPSLKAGIDECHLGRIVAEGTALNCRNQAIALKFRLLSVRVASGASVSNRKMSVMASGC